MTTAMTDEERKQAFAAAVRNCVEVEHGGFHCSFGGPSLHGLYWIVEVGCPHPHGDQCTWCGSEAETGFPAYAEGHEGDDEYRYLVPACEGCAREWVRVDPRWRRR